MNPFYFETHDIEIVVVNLDLVPIYVETLVKDFLDFLTIDYEPLIDVVMYIENLGFEILDVVIDDLVVVEVCVVNLGVVVICVLNLGVVVLTLRTL